MLALAPPLGTALALSVRAAVGAVGGGWARGGGCCWCRRRRAPPRSGNGAATRRAAWRCARRARCALPGCTDVVPALRMARSVRDQAGLGGAARAANLAGAVHMARVRPGRWPAARVLLVDDVVTTGATLGRVRGRPARRRGAGGRRRGRRGHRT